MDAPSLRRQPRPVQMRCISAAINSDCLHEADDASTSPVALCLSQHVAYTAKMSGEPEIYYGCWKNQLGGEYWSVLPAGPGVPVTFRWLKLTSSAGSVCTVEGWVYDFTNGAIGVWFGLAQPIVLRLIKHIFAWCLKLCFRNGSLWLFRLRNWISRGLSLLVILLSIAYAVAGAFVTALPSKESALSGSRECGLWSLRDDANGAAQDDDALIQGRKEFRAGLYARNCYANQAVSGLDQCKIFIEPHIDFETATGLLDCPFANSTYCAGSSFTTSRFSTGLMDSKVIGLNFAKRPVFNRTTLCVPLNIDAGFVQSLNNTHGQWLYDLGPVGSDVGYRSNYTFTQSGDPFYYDVRAYTMRRVLPPFKIDGGV